MKNRMKEIRKEKKMTQESLATELGTTRSAYAMYELGRVVPTPVFIKHFCNTFNLNEEWLLTGVGVKYSEDSEKQTEAEQELKNLFENADERTRRIITALSNLSDDELIAFEILAKNLSTNKKG